MLISSTLLSRPSCRPDSFVIPFRSPLCLVARSIRRNCPPVKSTGERQLTAITKVEFCHILSVFQIWTFSLYFSSKLEVEFWSRSRNTTQQLAKHYSGQCGRLAGWHAIRNQLIWWFQGFQHYNLQSENYKINVLTHWQKLGLYTQQLEDLRIWWFKWFRALVRTPLRTRRNRVRERHTFSASLGGPW